MCAVVNKLPSLKSVSILQRHVNTVKHKLVMRALQMGRDDHDDQWQLVMTAPDGDEIVPPPVPVLENEKEQVLEPLIST